MPTNLQFQPIITFTNSVTKCLKPSTLLACIWGEKHSFFCIQWNWPPPPPPIVGFSPTNICSSWFLNFRTLHDNRGGMRWRGWFRKCATNRKFVGLNPDGVIEIFSWYNPPGRTMTLGSTQPLTEINTSNISWGVKAASVDCRLSWNMGSSTSWSPKDLSRSV
jgi:hypothetical protein